MPESNTASRTTKQPPDWQERQCALDPTRSFLVQAPAGSGKTYLLTQRFLRLLALAEKPDAVVAITFTNAAAAEMRHRILGALETAQERADSGADSSAAENEDPESLEALATRAMERSRLLGWEILDQPRQLRVMTIDSFCRSIALQSPLGWGMLSGLGGQLDTVQNPKDLYRKAARRTLEVLELEVPEATEAETRRAVEEVLLWRDNNWQEVETLIVDMLGARNRWRQEFVFAREKDWEALRERLERPFCRSVRAHLERLAAHFEQLPGFHDYVLSLARFACETPGKSSPHGLAERAELPLLWDVDDPAALKLLLADAVDAYRDLAKFLLTTEGAFRKKGGLTAVNGFPANTEGKAQKERFGALLDSLREVDGLEAALAIFQKPLPVGYTEDEWKLIQHCFTVLRDAAGQLQVVFAETGTVDFTEIAHMALTLLTPEDGIPSEVAIRQAESIHHLLIDEFQDTSRNQHQLLAYLIGAWPEREGRSCFCVGDPMQSIYSFREAEVELFDRLKTHGFPMGEILDAEPFRLEYLSLRANFRTAPSLVADLNGHFEQIFAEDDGSGVRFSAAQATRDHVSPAKAEVHLVFTYKGRDTGYEDCVAEATRKAQLEETVALIRDKLLLAEEARRRALEAGSAEKFRIAVLGRTRASVARVAQALANSEIGFRAIELVPLRERAEVLDALALMRALLNPVDRTAWLAILRAPWCGLSLAELHLLTSADDPTIQQTPVAVLLRTRLLELSAQGLLESRAVNAAERVSRVLDAACGQGQISSVQAPAIQTLGTRIESVWKALGGVDTVGPTEHENLRLLWKALDKLPEGEVDLLGAGLKGALENLFALPDPAASSDFGVQLMTIHKSKGLEFEVVIVPELEASGKSSEPTMITWLERGLSGSDPADAGLTEFLIAPIQAKGTDAGAAKSWVDRVKQARETQELRRLLYVASTRAREELHLFARPGFSIGKSQSAPTLAKTAGLLATAWPALSVTIEGRFAEWCSDRGEVDKPESQIESQLEYLAAGGDPAKVLTMPGSAPAAQRPSRPTMLRRLAADYVSPQLHRGSTSSADGQAGQSSDRGKSLFTRTEGGLESRLLGTAIHGLLERLTVLRQSLTPAEAAEAIHASLPQVIARMRGQGLARRLAERLAAEALRVARVASLDAVGAWILAPHAKAASESRWTGLIGTGLDETGMLASGLGRASRWNVRPDRVFFAALPAFAQTGSSSTTSEPAWWIIDYKTGDYESGDAAEVPSQSAKVDLAIARRELYRGQLDVYARVLRQLRQAEGEALPTIRTGIYYPRMGWLDPF